MQFEVLDVMEQENRWMSAKEIGSYLGFPQSCISIGL